jgi:hypothetical protein
MTTKLTLTLEKQVVQKARVYARQTGRSLSQLIGNYLESITEDVNCEKQLSPKLRKIAGVVKLPDDFDEKKELRIYFAAGRAL